jgi:formylglycine-generating enzyme required for sulfatase activity
VRDLNGLVWEWVGDFNALLVGVDSRDQDGADKLEFCGTGAISMQEKENYATLMRVAMLSALKAVDTTNNMGFRCAKPQ